MDANETKLQQIDNPIENALRDFNMKEVILNQHPRHDAPATHNRGSKPIDGIFATPIFHDQPCGYLDFTDGPGDHRPTWQDVPLTTIFGAPAKQAFIPPQARRLQCRDPRTMKKYQQLYMEFVSKHKLLERACKLEGEYSVPLTQAQANE